MFKSCDHCGANLDPEEHCDCRKAEEPTAAEPETDDTGQMLFDIPVADKDKPFLHHGVAI